ncbi:Crp/Fnr family transcriptional regulator [Hyphomonas sp.]|jgi:CRP/FNR family cyclic AMP-dependent transcriptional regulator|uniref:Crp/Fnr family transcriptional regulator n=1 Tax=Hyphomonas sp. TaxID=87 RepID=UPI0032F031CF
MSDERIGQLLAASPVFGDLDSDTLHEIAGRGRVRKVARGEMLFSIGDQGDSMMAVLSGRVLLTRVTSEGKEIALDAIERGHAFGELSLIDGEPRSADATMVEAGELFVLQRSAFQALLAHQPAIAIALLGELTRMIRRTNRLVESVSFLELGPRLARLLLILAEACENRADGAIVLSAQYTQGELAKRIAASRESVSKQIAIWTRDGILGKENGRLVILKVDAINTLADDLDLER